MTDEGTRCLFLVKSVTVSVMKTRIFPECQLLGIKKTVLLMQQDEGLFCHSSQIYFYRPLSHTDWDYKQTTVLYWCFLNLKLVSPGLSHRAGW